MIEITCKYIKIGCICNGGCNCIFQNLDAFEYCGEQCEDYSPKRRNKIKQDGVWLLPDRTCEYIEYRNVYFHNTVKHFEFDECEDIVIGNRHIPYDSIVYLIVKEGNREEWLIGEKEEE